MHDSFESGSTAEITGTAPGATAEKRTVTITVYDAKDSKNILYMKDITVDEQDAFTLNIPLVSVLWDEGSYSVSVSSGSKVATVEFELSLGLEEIRNTVKFLDIRETDVAIQTKKIEQDEQLIHPRIIQGTLVAGPYGTGQAAGISLFSPTGTCVVGVDDSCIVKEITRGPTDGPYVIVDVDGALYKVRYSGPDANIEMFTVLPALQGQVFDDSTWQVKIHDEGLPTKFHYKITYVG